LDATVLAKELGWPAVATASLATVGPNLAGGISGGGPTAGSL
jgi:hypothetical protein